MTWSAKSRLGLAVVALLATRRKRAPKPSTGLTDSFGKPDSVEQCLAILGEVAEEQRGRNRHLDTKAASIAGFAGTALTLNLTLGNPLLGRPFRAHPWEQGVIRDAFIATAVLFAVAGVTALGGVLRPARTKDLDEAAIDAYGDRPKVITPPSELRETWLQTVVATTLADRKAGNAKATWSNVGVVMLVLGIIGLLVQAVTLAVAS